MSVTTWAHTSTGVIMATDLPCGCRISPTERLCGYHEGRSDERDEIVSYLSEAGEDGLASQIENGFHIGLAPAQRDGRDAP